MSEEKVIIIYSETEITETIVTDCLNCAMDIQERLFLKRLLERLKRQITND